MYKDLAGYFDFRLHLRHLGLGVTDRIVVADLEFPCQHTPWLVRVLFKFFQKLVHPLFPLVERIEFSLGRSFFPVSLGKSECRLLALLLKLKMRIEKEGQVFRKPK